jgi:hypothetical protein
VISSRKSVPPFARSKQPARRSVAPVKLPFSCPNSSDSISVGEIAPQFSGTNDPSERTESSCSVSATSSLPVPVSPVTSTVASVRATLST